MASTITAVELYRDWKANDFEFHFCSFLKRQQNVDIYCFGVVLIFCPLTPSSEMAKELYDRASSTTDVSDQEHFSERNLPKTLERFKMKPRLTPETITESLFHCKKKKAL